MTASKFGVGQSIPRSEDDPLLRGHGCYVADVHPDGTLHAIVLRSPHAHAGFSIGDLAAARALPGVRLILTGADVAGYGPIPCEGLFPNSNITVPPYRLLATETVRHVGDAVAFIVADTPEEARAAAEAIAIAWEPKPAVVGADAALRSGAPQIWPVAPGNLVFDYTQGDRVATEAAFRTAARVVSLDLVNQRLVTNYMETRGVVAEHDGASGRFTLTLGSQGGHWLRDMLCDEILRIPRDRMRVITRDVGGGFGTKVFMFREYPLAAIAAERLGRPVKWVCDRTEHFLADAQGRDNLTTARLAVDAKGRFLALEVDTVADMGAYLSGYAPYIPILGAPMLPGVYDIPVCHVRIRGAYTNTLPVDAYRGAGRPEASYVIERLVDVAARDLGIAPDVLRRRNFIKPSAMPYKTATGRSYDSGEFAGHLDRAQQLADWSGFGRRLAQSKKAGRLRGIGVATYIEACGANGPELATIRLDADGGLTVLIGSQSTGQGHRTAYAQLVAETLDLPPDRVRLVQGDTDQVVSGVGTGGSSAITAAGASLARATVKLSDNLKALAAEALEVGVADLEMAAGTVRVAGTDRVITFADLAAHGREQPERLTAQDTFEEVAATYPNGSHVVEVEIDPASGETEIVRYAVVDDFGATLNPLLLAGQVHGGAVQGIGQALMENTVYDRASGQLLSASLMDYALPRAREMPSFIFETRNVPCRVNPLGMKGAGEAGTIGAAPAVMNAVCDALWRAFRIRHIDMPATPARVWAALEEGRRVHTL